MHGVSELRRRRGELVAERNRLYDVESFVGAAGRVLIRVPGEPIDESVWGGIFRTCEDVRQRTDALHR